MIPAAKKVGCTMCGAIFDSPFHTARYCSPQCKREGKLFFARARKSLVQPETSLFMQKVEWAPQAHLSEEQEQQAQMIAEYCTKSALRYCKMLLANW